MPFFHKFNNILIGRIYLAVSTLARICINCYCKSTNYTVPYSYIQVRVLVRTVPSIHPVVAVWGVPENAEIADFEPFLGPLTLV